MTIAEYLEQKGRKEGRLEGLEEGKLKEALKIARSMLANGFERTMVMKLTGLSAEEVDQLCH
ncbi:hypothetical protein [Serratia sp. 2723]|uniref:hypothetical protein n=1 Tax=unclassified Serratia (in: enterobacteria) TaxID=2647522 RepID=UPI003D2431CC